MQHHTERLLHHDQAGYIAQMRATERTTLRGTQRHPRRFSGTLGTSGDSARARCPWATSHSGSGSQSRGPPPPSGYSGRNPQHPATRTGAVRTQATKQILGVIIRNFGTWRFLMSKDVSSLPRYPSNLRKHEFTLTIPTLIT
jgi:hypothetical protein